MAEKTTLRLEEDEEARVLEEHRGDKHFQPDEEGYNLYFPKREAELYNLSSDTSIDEVYLVNNDQVEWIGRASLDAGFSRSDLLDYAENNGWTMIDEYDGEEWSYSFEESEYGTTISVDNPVVVDGEPLNNVFVRSMEVSVEPDLRGYDHLKAVAKQSGIHVGVRDNLGLWQQLKSNTKVDANDLEVLSQLAKKADVVEAHLKYQYPSIWMNLDQLGALVENINKGIENYLEVYGDEMSERFVTN